jgi:ribose 5-phosphate isomerase B
MKIVVAADSAGKPLKDVVAAHLAKRPGVEVVDLSPDAANAGEYYASTAERAAQALVSGQADKGFLFCGTGIGVAMAANKVPGVRAAQAHDTYSAERASLSNDAHIVTMGARVVGPELGKAIADAFLNAKFDPASHSAANVAAVDALDAKYHGKG